MSGSAVRLASPGSRLLDVLATQLVGGLAAGLNEKRAEAADGIEASPLVRIISGHPCDEDIAAVMAVLIASQSTPSNMPQPPMSSLGDWGNPTDQLRYGLGSAPAHFVHAHFTR